MSAEQKPGELEAKPTAEVDGHPILGVAKILCGVCGHEMVTVVEPNSVGELICNATCATCNVVCDVPMMRMAAPVIARATPKEPS